MIHMVLRTRDLHGPPDVTIWTFEAVVPATGFAVCNCILPVRLDLYLNVYCFVQQISLPRALLGCRMELWLVRTPKKARQVLARALAAEPLAVT